MLDLRLFGHSSVFGMQRRQRCALMALLLVATAVGSGCASVPSFSSGYFLEKAMDDPISEDAVAEAEARDELMQGEMKFSSPRSFNVRKLQRMVDRIALQSQRDGLELQVRLIEDDRTVNAFVTGAQYVYVYTGLLGHVKSDDELAFVLAHEIAHIDGKHVERGTRVARAFSWIEPVAEALGSIFAVDFIRDVEEKANRYGALIPMKFQRDLEAEADALGVIYASRAGYDAIRGAEFFAKMEKRHKKLNAKVNAALGNYRTVREAYIVADLVSIIPGLGDYAEKARDRFAKMARSKAVEKGLRLERQLQHEWASTHPPREDRVRDIRSLAEYDGGDDSELSSTSRTVLETIRRRSDPRVAVND